MMPDSTGSVFYVDPVSGLDGNAGTIGSPWQTLSKCNSTLTAGQKAYLRAGTYGDATVSQSFTMTGSAGSPITIEAYPGEVADIRTRLRPTTGHHIRFKGLSFSTPIYISGSPDSYIWVNGADDIEIVGCTFATSDHSSIFVSPNSDRTHILRNVFNTNGDGTAPQDHGIYCDGNAFLIHSNVIYDSYVFGIQIVGDGAAADNGIIAFNTIYGNGESDAVTPAGIMLDAASGGTCIGTVVTSNIISTNNGPTVNGYGIRVRNDVGGQNYSQNNLIRNNNAGTYEDPGSLLTRTNDVTAGSEGFTNAGARDLSITSSSVALGIGDSRYALPNDVAGNARLPIPAAGAYEFQPTHPFAYVGIGA